MPFTLICLLLFKNLHLFCHIPSAWLCFGRQGYDVHHNSLFCLTDIPISSFHLHCGKCWGRQVIHHYTSTMSLSSFHNSLLSPLSPCFQSWSGCQWNLREVSWAMKLPSGKAGGIFIINFHLSCDLNLWDLRVLLLSIKIPFRFCEKNSNQSTTVV